jgi:hypothetical protein
MLGANFQALAGMGGATAPTPAVQQQEASDAQFKQAMLYQQQLLAQQQAQLQAAAPVKKAKPGSVSASLARCRKFQKVINGKDQFNLINTSLRLELNDADYNTYLNHVGLSMRAGVVF